MRILLAFVSLVVTLLPVAGIAADRLPRADLVMWMQEEPGIVQQLGIQQIFNGWAAQYAPGSTLTLVPKVAEDIDTDFRAADRKPDMLWIAADFVSPWAAAHLIQSVDQMVDTFLFIPTITALARIDGQTYGIPVQAGNHLLLYYNKKLVKQAPRTFTELVQIAKALATRNTTPKVVPFAYYQYDPFWVFPIAHAFGATEFDKDGATPALNTEGWVKTYQLLADLKFKEEIEPDRCDYACADLGFKAGTTAMILNVDWALYGDNGYIRVLGNDLGVAPWPSVGPDPARNIPTPFISGLYLVFPQTLTDDKLRTATAFVRFLTTDEATALQWTLPNGRLPALLSALKNEKITGDPILSVSSAVMLSGIAQPVQPAWDCVWRMVAKQNALVISSAAKAPDAAANAQKEAVDCIARLK